jgi:hypothetical protein
LVGSDENEPVGSSARHTAASVTKATTGMIAFMFGGKRWIVEIKSEVLDTSCKKMIKKLNRKKLMQVGRREKTGYEELTPFRS